LLPYGAELLAVEPVRGMREQLLGATAGIKVIDGTAERIGIPDASVDVLLMAQAFHWFDTTAAGAEIHRVLVAGGGLGVIWNSWDESVPSVARMQRLVHEHVGQTPQQGTRRWQEELEAGDLFTPLQEQVVAQVVHGDLDALLSRVASVSYIAALADRGRQRVLDGVRELVAGRSANPRASSAGYPTSAKGAPLAGGGQVEAEPARRVQIAPMTPSGLEQLYVMESRSKPKRCGRRSSG
jgi:hypothetical protein